MDNSQLINVLDSLFAGQAFLQWLLEFTLKSSAIILITWLIAKRFRLQLSCESQHLLWLNGMLCIALLPVSDVLISNLYSSIHVGAAFGQLVVLPLFNAPGEAAAGSAIDLFLLTYSAVSIVLLMRLALAGTKLAALSQRAKDIKTESLLLRLSVWSNELGIRRTVRLQTSNDISSPISFGLLHPRIIVPEQALLWDSATFDDVLIHELSHIKRLDWPTMLFCQIVTGLVWFNPLVWMARKQVLLAAEETCDRAVLLQGSDGVRYAEDLLRLAKTNPQHQQTVLLAQAMFENSMLSNRIRHILSGAPVARHSRSFALIGCGVLMLALGACSNFALFGTAPEDQDYLPLVATSPQYPTRAAQRDIEGWALVGFTVTPQGTVDADSLHVVDAEPAGIFDQNSLAAAQQFTFQPRIRNGRAIAVPGVQYLFRYELTENSTMANVGRKPPPARSSR